MSKDDLDLDFSAATKGGEEPVPREEASTFVNAQWRLLTDAGNRTLHAGDDIAAARLYSEALVEAERLLEVARAGGGLSVLLAPMAYTIACHNAAEVTKRRGDDAACRDLRILAATKFVGVATSPTSPLPLRVNCVRHLRHALAFLAQETVGVSSADKHEIEMLVRRARTVAAEVNRVAGHVVADGWNSDRTRVGDPHAVH